MRYFKTFHQIVPIPNARVPIIKCVHTSTGFNCDLSFTSNLGVYNSNIVKDLINYDDRIHSLTMILKFWMRAHKISGTGKITNYSLFLLIVFYLQSLRQPILQPLNFFQNNIPPFFVGPWNLAWYFGLQIPMFNKQTVIQLVAGFFQFYSNFTFEKVVICPLYGRTYRRDEFANNKIPEGNDFGTFRNYMQTKEAKFLNTNTGICIQDPFQLSFNVAASCANREFLKFKNELAHAYKLTVESTELTKPKYLLAIFNGSAASTVELNNTVSLLSQTRVNTNVVVKEFDCNIIPLDAELSVVRTILSKIKLENPVEKIDIHRHWFEKCFDFIQIIFTDLMKFTITTDDDNHINKSPKLIGSTDVHTNEFCKTLRLHGTNDIYRNRKMIKRFTESYLTDELAKSNELFNLKVNPVDFHCLMKISTNARFDYVHLQFIDLCEKTKKKTFQLVFENITRFIRYHLRAYFLKYQKDSN